MKFHEKLKKIRTDKGFSQQDISNKLGISQQAYGQYETGKRNPKNSTRAKIAEALNIPISELLATKEELEEENKQIEAEFKIEKATKHKNDCENTLKKIEADIKSLTDSGRDVPEELAQSHRIADEKYKQADEYLSNIIITYQTNSIERDKIVENEWEKLGVLYWALSATRQNRLKEILQDMFNSEMYEKEQKKRNS